MMVASKQRSKHPSHAEPQQARSRATRQRILDQATIAFAQHGFDATSLTRDILGPAGVGASSFYRLFDDKLDLFLISARQGGVQMKAQIALIAKAASEIGGDVDLEFGMGLEFLFSDVNACPERWMVHFRELGSATPEIRGVFLSERQIWVEWAAKHVQEVGKIDEDLALRAVNLAYNAVIGALRDYLMSPAEQREVRRSVYVSDLTAFCVAGMIAVVTQTT